jgi:hypothetical protein
MATDLTTRILVTGILLCVLLLLVQRLRPAGEGAAAEEGPEKGRYQIIQLATQEEPVLLRTDTVTGRMWRSEDLLEGARWVALAEPPPEEERGAFDEPTAEEQEGRVEPPEAAAAMPPEAAPAKPPGPEASGSEVSLELLTAMLVPDSPPDMQIWAAEQLAQSSSDAAEVVPLLLGALEQEDAEVLVAVIEALERRADAAAVAPLRTLLTHPDAQVRARAQEAIAVLE